MACASPSSKDGKSSFHAGKMMGIKRKSAAPMTVLWCLASNDKIILQTQTPRRSIISKGEFMAKKNGNHSENVPEGASSEPGGFVPASYHQANKKGGGSQAGQPVVNGTDRKSVV